MLETGCYFDSHRGHYIVPAVIDLGRSHGYILDPFVEFAVARYEDWYHDADFPAEALIEVSDDVIGWLNGDGGSGPKQPDPPEIPDGTVWMWLDGDFGLYEIGDED